MKKLVILVITAAFALGTLGCGATPKAKSDAEATKTKSAKKSLKKMKGNRMEMSVEDE
jgi:Ni/Co efflux regulator RcnB